MKKNGFLILKKIIFLAIFGILIFGCSKKTTENFKNQNEISQNLNENKTNFKRIVSLSPASTEIICAIGAIPLLVARSDFCDFPEEVKNIESVGGFDGKSLSIEKILSFKPDFVYLTKGMHDHLLIPLKNQGIYCFVSEANSINKIIEEIEQIGNLLGNPYKKNAKNVCNQIQNEIKTIQKKVVQNQKNINSLPKIYWEIWSQPYMSVGKNSFINEIITIAGGKNIFENLEQAYPVVSDEAIIFENPDIIFIPDSKKDEINQIKNRAGWKNINAVKNNKIFSINEDLISRPGPRISQGIELFFNILQEN